MDDRAGALLQLLFRVPGDMAAWWPFLEAVGRAISPDVVALAMVESPPPAVTTAMFMAGAQHTTRGTLPLSARQRRRLDATPEGTLFEFPPASRAVRNRPEVQALLAPEGILTGPGFGVVIAREGSRATAALLVLPRKAGWRPRAADRRLLSDLAPFLPLATELHTRLVGTGAMTTILDQLVLGVILLDQGGHVSYANRSAAELLGVEAGFAPISRAERRDSRAEALQRILSHLDADSELRHPLDGRPLQVLATSLDWPNKYGLPARQFARAIFLGDPERSGADEPMRNFGAVYGFTPAEARFAWLLVGDRTLAEAAEQLGITESTARTVLKRILAKTGTRRQASLVRLLLSGPAQLRRDARSSGAGSRRSPRGRGRPGADPPNGGCHPRFEG